MQNKTLAITLGIAGKLAIIVIASLPSLAAAVVPVNTQLPTVSGTLKVGSTITINPGVWTGDHPITFAYNYKICSSTGTDCIKAPGLFTAGPRPTLLLVAGTAGKKIKVVVTATNPSGKKNATTALTGVVAAYPSSAAPLVEYINGLPEDISYSSKTIFQFQPTGTGITLTCQLDNQPAKTCPTNNKVTYGNLTPGSHTVKVTATNSYGSQVASHTWTVAPLPAPVACIKADSSACYHPPVGATWQWQLNPDNGQTGINTSIVADMYDIDGYANDAAVVALLKSLPGNKVPNRSVTCYITAGTLENWRSDSEDLNPQVLGNTYSGFADERWIDVRQLSKVGPWLEKKMQMCKDKGFDAIEFDNVDGWQTANKTGLNITFEDEVAFIVYLANSAHDLGLTMALKSNVEQIPNVLNYVDFAVVEECFAYKECTRTDPNTEGQYGYDMFIEAGKPVFEVEYKRYDPSNNVCARANSLDFSTMYKKVALDSYRVACWK